MVLGGKILTWYDNQWFEGNTPIIGAADHAAWLGSTVFDGARQFEGVRPDMMLNCQRIIYSAEAKRRAFDIGKRNSYSVEKVINHTRVRGYAIR